MRVASGVGRDVGLGLGLGYGSEVGVGFCVGAGFSGGAGFSYGFGLGVGIGVGFGVHGTSVRKPPTPTRARTCLPRLGGGPTGLPADVRRRPIPTARSSADSRHDRLYRGEISANTVTSPVSRPIPGATRAEILGAC